MPIEEFERRDYNDLVEEGGRPLYSCDLIDEVARDPFSHWDMLRPWVDHDINFEPDPDPEADLHVDWTVFGPQLGSWRDFCDWQKFNRGDFTRWDDSYEARAAYNYFVRAFRRELPTYTDAVKKLLQGYGFDRSFQFHEDPTQQDKLTTWIEYLGYECWVHYRYASRVKRMQPKYDAAWETLVDANVLRPFETEEYVCNIESSFRRQSEREQATRTVALAKSAAKAILTSVHNDINHPRGSRLTPAARVQRMESAKSSCETAEEALMLIKRRNGLVTDFKQSVGTYLISKKEAEKHDLRVRWALEQLSLIEVELSESCMAEISTKTHRGVKRSRDASHDRTAKKQRRDAGASGPRSGPSGGPDPQNPKLKRGCNDTADNGPTSKRLKRDRENPDETSSRSNDPDCPKVNSTRDHEDATNARPPAKPRKRRGEDIDSLRTRAKLERDRQDVTDDGPPSKQVRRRGEDLNLPSQTRDGSGLRFAEAFHESDAVRTTAKLKLKRSEPVSDHQQRRTSTRSAAQPLPVPSSLRRSARIAARHPSITVKNIPQSTRRSMAPVPKPTSHIDLQYQQSNPRATRARAQSVRVSERARAT